MLKQLVFFLLIGLLSADIASAQIFYALIPESPQPGDPITIGVNTSFTEALLFADGTQVARAGSFFVPPEDEQPGFYAAIIAVPTTVTASNVLIRLNNRGVTIREIPVKLTPKEFRSENLYLTPTMVSIVTDPNPQIQIERDRFWQIIMTTGNQVYHAGEFMIPVDSTRRTSIFGARRVNIYPEGWRSIEIHAGVDFGSPSAERSIHQMEVYACGRGLVVLARMRILSGNSVIIEHAPGVYSVYYHLDSISAQEGAIVEMGTVIGRVGSTGYSTGSHLHWELRVGAENTDPDAFVSRPILDKELIISKIYNRNAKDLIPRLHK
ncbi:MAG: M23 family metallopeptidase [Treponema sp.]|nr:M23 family metallopeptidase [Treponema sp.]